MSAAVLDSEGLVAWGRSRPPDLLLEVLEAVAQAGGSIVVPTVVVAEATTGRADRDALVNQRIKRARVDPCPLPLARRAAVLRSSTSRSVSTVDAIVAATAEQYRAAAVATSDPKDLTALLAAATHPTRVVTI